MFVRPAADFDEGDGVQLGRLLCYSLSKVRKNADELREELNTFIERATVLRECAYKHRFLDELLFHIIKNKTKLGAVQSSFTVKTGLASLKKEKVVLRMDAQNPPLFCAFIAACARGLRHHPDRYSG